MWLISAISATSAVAVRCRAWIRVASGPGRGAGAFIIPRTSRIGSRAADDRSGSPDPATAPRSRAPSSSSAGAAQPARGDPGVAAAGRIAASAGPVQSETSTDGRSFEPGGGLHRRAVARVWLLGVVTRACTGARVRYGATQRGQGLADTPSSLPSSPSSPSPRWPSSVARLRAALDPSTSSSARSSAS